MTNVEDYYQGAINALQNLLTERAMKYNCPQPSAHNTVKRNEQLTGALEERLAWRSTVQEHITDYVQQYQADCQAQA